jgi:hypothetical protein
VAAASGKVTPTASMSWAYRAPSWSSATRPRKAARPPNDASPARVLAAEPPDVSLAAPMAA